MEITWFGLSCFRITERGLPTIVTDPYDHKDAGYKPLKLKSDIVTVSHDAPGHNNVGVVKGYKWDLRTPGEYEIGEILITGVGTSEGKKDRNLVYLFDYDGLTIGHLGDMSSVPTRAQVEAFGIVDVLLIPVGGGNALTAAKAAEVIALIEPGLVIPMHYKTKDSKLKLNALRPFLQEMGVEKEKAQPSIKVTRSAIPDETEVIVLELSG